MPEEKLIASAGSHVLLFLFISKYDAINDMVVVKSIDINGLSLFDELH